MIVGKKLKFIFVLCIFLPNSSERLKVKKADCSLEFGLTEDLSNFVGGDVGNGKLERIERRKKLLGKVLFSIFLMFCISYLSSE